MPRRKNQILENEKRENPGNGEQSVIVHHPLHELHKKPFLDGFDFFGINRICFRGDDRDPEEIFKIGFSAKDCQDEEGCDHSLVSLFSSSHMVSFSKRFTVASLFPQFFKIGKVTPTWVYVCYLDYGFDVHSHSLTYYMQSSPIEFNTSRYLHKVYAEEIVRDYLPTKDIIAALLIERTQFSHEHHHTEGENEIKEVRYNANCTVDQKIKDCAKKFIEDEVKVGKQKYVTPYSAYYACKDKGKIDFDLELSSKAKPKKSARCSV